MSAEPQRPDPDALLKRLKTEERPSGRGRLRIFLGFAAGVGKTYAMLEAAREQLALGRDVVVAYVETHGRKETEALAAGLPTIPRRRVEYHNVTIEEMDLDAVLARRPQLALVDELAHTNAPGSRHARRFHDVDELLAAGIDVYTTLNVQHVESLNDVVAQITGVTVRETVPDRILEEADEVELVDLSPDELIQRLREGKVYVPEQAVRAIRKFFRPGNLTALREISLRYLAGRVDRQMRTYMDTHEIPGPWPAGERVLVAIGPGPLAEKVVRAGRRLAAGLDAEWIAIVVETPEYHRLPQSERDRISRALRLAEELGAKTEIITGTSPPQEIVRYARAHNVTKIVAGVSLRPWWERLIRGSLVDWVLRHGDNIDVYAITAPVGRKERPGVAAPVRPRGNLRAYLFAAGVVALVTSAGQFIYGSLEPANLTMLYLLAVVIVALQWGRGPSILAATLSVVAFDFFFVPPRFTMVVDDTQYLITFAALLVVGLVISALASRVRDQVHIARQGEAAAAALYALSHDIAGATSLEEMLAAIARHVGSVFNRSVAIFLADGGRPEVAYQSGEFPLTDNERAVAAWVHQHGEPAGHGTETLPAARARYLPLRTAQGTRGVLGVLPPEPTGTFAPEQQQLLQAFASQAALALERVQRAAADQRIEISRETEKLQSAVLSSISHDLRTPLAAVSGALSSLMDDDIQLDDAGRRELLETAKQGADRLNHLVGNLLDMTRVEAGGLKLRKEPGDIEDIVGAALAQLGETADREIAFELPSDLPSVPMDFVLITQVMRNLLDNAVKYSPDGTPVTVGARLVGPEVQVFVVDRGPGIPDGDLQRVFEKFYRAGRREDEGGVGLGLAISKGIVEAHGGRIWAENRPGGGTAVTFTMPFVLAEPGEIRERLDDPLRTASSGS